MKPVPFKKAESNDAGDADAQQDAVKTIDQLERELEMLAYVTSHNLQSPLRAILGYCEEINRQPGIKSKTVTRETADALTHEAKRLKDMLQVMMEYIQLETHPVKHAQVNCSEVLHTVLTMHGHDIETAKAEIRMGELPSVWGHYGRITRLFGYLIDNAIKFRGTNPCVIDIKVRSEGKFWEFTVRDNGIGMNEDYTDIVFRLFKRLHTAEDYPGYGAGLSLSKKIVEAHGGKIRIDSKTGQGACVIFTLPKMPAEKS